MKSKTREYIRISQLIAGSLKEELTLEQQQELDAWIEKPGHRELYQRIRKKQNLEEKFKQYQAIDKEKAWQKILQQGDILAGKRIRLWQVMRYAAVFILLLTIAGIIWRKNFSGRDQGEVVARTDSLSIKPGQQRATLVLASGERIDLDQTEQIFIVEQGGTEVVDSSNLLVYKPQEHNDQLVYNTLETPRGGEYHLQLADGSEVWLNAESTLRYPVQFSDTIRQVFLEGEGFFKVAENVRKPFIVNTKQVDIRVLGTSFNVQAYSDEQLQATTLVEGKVQISNKVKGPGAPTTEVLHSGHQALVKNNEPGVDLKEVDTEIFTSWKDGEFAFRNESLESIMRKLARWYDVEVVFENKQAMNYHFTGNLKRYNEIDYLLNMIKLTTNVDFEITERNVIVTTKKE